MPSSLLFWGEGDVVVEVEVAAVGGDPGEGPAHALFEGLDFGECAAGDGYVRDVVMLEVLACAVDMVGEEGAAGAAFFPSGAEHEVIDDELAASGKEIGEGYFTAGAVEDVGLGDFDPGERAAFCAEGVTGASMGFFLDQKCFAGFEPLGF